MNRRTMLILMVLGVAIGLLAAYLYGRHSSCPPPHWWLTLFRQSGTYRCAG